MKPSSARWFSIAVAFFFAAAIGVSSSANAAFIAYICDDLLCTGGGDTIVTDQGVGDNFPGSAVVGQINAGAISVGGFTIVTNVANVAGAPATPTLDLTFVATTSDQLAHTIYLYTSVTGLTGQGTFAFSLGGTQPPTGGGNSVTGRAYGGNSNSNLDLSNLLASLGPSSVSPFNPSMSGAFVPTVKPYALTIGMQITRASAGTSGGGLEFSVAPIVAAVPEPETLPLVLLGVVCVSLATARRRRTG